MVRVLVIRTLYLKILDELSSLKLWKKKTLERKEKGKERIGISQGEREQIREEEIKKNTKRVRKQLAGPRTGRVTINIFSSESTSNFGLEDQDCMMG